MGWGGRGWRVGTALNPFTSVRAGREGAGEKRDAKRAFRGTQVAWGPYNAGRARPELFVSEVIG